MPTRHAFAITSKAAARVHADATAAAMLEPEEEKEIIVPGVGVWLPGSSSTRDIGDAAAPFVKGEVLAPPSADGMVRIKIAGGEKTVPVAALCPACPDDRTSADNTALPFLSEATLLHNVRVRYEAKPQQMYTYTGAILIAVNPFRVVDGVYDDSTMEKYRGRPIGAESPHSFAIADRAYRLCVVDKLDQSVVVSGESGAGKTESARFVLQYLRFVSNASEDLELRIHTSQPLTEAFGCAKTMRNDNRCARE